MSVTAVAVSILARSIGLAVAKSGFVELVSSGVGEDVGSASRKSCVGVNLMAASDEPFVQRCLSLVSHMTVMTAAPNIITKSRRTIMELFLF